jgi:hypothetical protein
VGQTLVARGLTTVLTVPRRGQRRRAAVRFDDVVRPELRTGADETLERRVYHLA